MTDATATPSRTDPLVRQASEILGGPIGRYAAPASRGWRHLASLLVAASAVPLAGAVAIRGWCVDAGWRSPDQFWHACFSDLPATFHDANLGAGVVALLSGAPEAPHLAQPPLTALVMTSLGGLVPDGSLEARMRFYFGMWAVLGGLLWALTTWWTAAAAHRVPIRAAHVALSPVVVLTALVGPDVLGVALVAAGLLAWSRARLVWSGVLLGLACSARTYPVLVVFALLFLAIRTGRVRSWSITAGSAAAAFAVCATALLVANPGAAVRSYTSWAESGAGFGSLWLVPQLGNHPMPIWLVTLLAVLGWALALLAGAAVALAAPVRPTVAEVTLVMVAVALATGKSVPVQASLWLVPLLALAGLRWRDHLLWAAAEFGHFLAVWLYLAGLSTPDRGLPAGWYAVFLVLRLVAIGWLAVDARGRAWRRSADRPANREPDPIAGVFAHRRDALVVQLT